MKRRLDAQQQACTGTQVLMELRQTGGLPPIPSPLEAWGVEILADVNSFPESAVLPHRPPS